MVRGVNLKKERPLSLHTKKKKKGPSREERDPFELPGEEGKRIDRRPPLHGRGPRDKEVSI